MPDEENTHTLSEDEIPSTQEDSGLGDGYAVDDYDSEIDAQPEDHHEQNSDPEDLPPIEGN